MAPKTAYPRSGTGSIPVARLWPGVMSRGVKPMDSRQSDFARVYEEHVWRVYAFVAYRVGDPHLAEDLTQVSFERALRAWSRFDPRRGSEVTWLLAIARNAIIDHHRRHHREQLDPGELLTGAVPGPEERLGGSAELADALSTLSERDREILGLRFGAELTGPEIAAMTGLTLANVQQILSRSLRHLRTLLGTPRKATSGVG